MPHFPKPFFRKDRGLWYVQLHGKQHNLGPDKDAAFTAYHKLMAQPEQKPVRSDSVVAVIDEYLEWCHKHRRTATLHSREL
jgi:hypothetical protein